MNESCVFCKIIAEHIPARFVYRDDEVVAIEDVNPQAPSHILVMPVRHAEDLQGFVDANSPESVAKVFRIASRIGSERGANGFRTVVNTGEAGGQTVPHLHVHVLAGRQMHWPPG